VARDYGAVSPRFWTGDTGKKLRRHPDAQRLAVYLMTCHGSSMTGLYYLPLPVVAHEVGMTIEEATDAFGVLAELEFASYDPREDLVFVREMAAWQVEEELQPNDNRIKGVKRELAPHRHHPFVSAFWARYEVAFSLGPLPPQHQPRTRPASPIEAPSQAPSEAPSKPGSGSGSGSGSEQDQPPERAHAHAISRPPPPPTTTRAPARWSADRWFDLFKSRWGDAYGKLTYGGGTSAARAVGELSEILASIPAAEVIQAQGSADRILATYLGDKSPGLVKANHPWPFFVQRFTELRATVLAPRTNGNGATAPPGPPKPRNLCPPHMGGFPKDESPASMQLGPLVQTCAYCAEILHRIRRSRTREGEPETAGELLARAGPR
jgi:hypothetical protein